MILRYKERLRTKHLKSLKPGDQLNCLNPRNWVLLRKNMDDFRDGNPPDFEGVYYLPVNMIDTKFHLKS